MAARRKETAIVAVTSDGDLSPDIASVATAVGSRREAAWIIEHVDEVLGLRGHARDETVRSLAARRRAGEPLQYVLGRWSFRTIELEVDQRVLIPRPETEQVVEVALARLNAARKGRGAAEAAACCDLGTGSGAIALSLAVEAPAPVGGLEIWATDRSPDALAVATANRDRLSLAGRLGSTRVELAEGDWFGALPASLVGRLDLIVANPPYVTASEYEELDPTIRCFEPRTALVSGPGRSGTPGMSDIEGILGAAPRWLRPGGFAVVEIAPHQADATVAAARAAGFASADIERDLAGRPRMVVAAC